MRIVKETVKDLRKTGPGLERCQCGGPNHERFDHETCFEEKEEAKV